ncbi:RNA polymerase [Aeromonas phage AerS_266]|nr:RNA polymerase [Aeromonas phage AerS_266]
MNKFDYLFEAFKQRAYVNKSFLLSVFSIVKDTPNNNNKLKTIPYALFRDDKEKQVYFIRDGERVVIDHPNFELPLFDKDEKVKVNPTIHEYIQDSFETTVGIFLTNLVVLYETIGFATSYINAEITGNKIKSIIDKVMVDDGIDIPEGKASVTDTLKITKNLDYLEGLNQVFVKASSLDVLTVHPEVVALRDKLLDELETQGKLNDPTAVAKAIDQVIELDAKIQYSGPSKDFFINPKFIDNARKKMFIIFDMVPDFNTGKYKLLRKSLNERWDIENYPAYINTAISASFDRGNATGEGGAEVKLAILLTGRMLAIDTDCETTRTETVVLSKLNFNGWVGGYFIKDGKVTLLDKTQTDLIGTTQEFRVPQNCKQPEDNLCRVCCGEKLGSIETRLSSETVFIFTQYMLTRMKAMHVSQLKTLTIPFDSMFR